ncbi:MAG: RelA/SpoT family protein [Candidatus Azobacteroides sp.]|nr:RelA/SpoT family protein [Candidatus Azobacteroides sp.]
MITTKVSLTEEEQQELIDNEFQALVDDYMKTKHRQKVEKITKAFTFAKQAHKGIKRLSGVPYIMHPLAVARIVVNEIGLGSTSICAALLHDVVEDTEYTVEDIKNVFGEKIAQIVDGLTKISGGIFADKATSQTENFRKLLLTMSEDIRVVLIKMADRLHNMRTLDSMLPNKQYKIAGETLYIYAPLAHRLGLFSIKTELEDLSFKYEHPKRYEAIRKKIEATAVTRNQLYKEFATPLRQKLDEMGIQYDMKNRVKSIYSISTKMQTKNIPFEEVYDLFAVRIVFTPTPEQDEKTECWRIYTAVTNIYRLHPERIRDWVSRPKANGYQALHLTVMGPNGQWIEVQIRSERMNEIAERGWAAHWKYKVGEDTPLDEDGQLDKWLKEIKTILEDPGPQGIDMLDALKMNLFSSEIFVFTPKGDIKTLPQNATVLDFAFSLHTDLGFRCIGAKINHRLVPISHKLQSGDQVEILISKSQKPKEEWFNFVTTGTAHAKIKEYLRKERRNYIKKGQKITLDFIEELKNSNTTISDDRLIHFFNYQDKENFFYHVGVGDIVLSENTKKLFVENSGNIIMRYLRRFGTNNKNITRQLPPTPPKPEKKEEYNQEELVLNKKKPFILDEESYNRTFVFAKCCNPIPGDDAVGYLENKKILIVHMRSCPVVIRLKSTYGERIFSVEWKMPKSIYFKAMIEIRGIDSVGILNKVTQVISNQDINIQKINTETTDGIFEGRIEILVHNASEVEDLCGSLLKIKDIESAVRYLE